MSFELSGPTNQKPYSIHEDEPVYWGQTTDPDQHNPDNFRYLVHAFNPFSLFNAIYTSKIIHQRKQVLLMMRYGVNLLTYELGQRRLMSECL